MIQTEVCLSFRQVSNNKPEESTCTAETVIHDRDNEVNKKLY